MGKITLKCKHCGDIITGINSRKIVFCKCKTIGTNGEFSYYKSKKPEDDFIEIYNDANKFVKNTRRDDHET